jgi:predicted nuclease of predicted toxin-antitoxin system
MKLLLDENIPHKLRQFLPGHEVFTVAYMGWSGMRNGQLLATAANEGFDALLTVDAGIGYQQNMAILPCSVVIIHAESNAFEHLSPHIPVLLRTLKSLKSKTLVKIP